MNAYVSLVVAIAASLCGCATAPRALDFEGEEDLWVMATALKPIPSEAGSSSWMTFEPLEGVECLLRNDHGEWRATTPQRVTVRLSRQNLVVDCVREGYEPLRQAFECVPPARGMGDAATVDVAALAVLAPLMIVGGPIGLAHAGGPFILHGASLAHGVASADRRDKCSHLAISVQMNRAVEAAR